MVIYTITNGTNKGFQECVFISTLDGIYLECPEDGFFKHPNFKTEQDLKPHLKQLKKDGFKVTKKTIKVKTSMEAGSF